jgi:thiamine biosynthesis lipoprotein
MGTIATVEVCDPLPPAEVLDAVFTWLHEVDHRFTTYTVDSEVSRFDARELSLVDCSADLRLVLERCAELWRDTDGFFDVYATGRLDPSGYVKGWAVQVASEMLTAAGAVNHYVDAGGDIQTRGRPGPETDWQIGVRHPWLAGQVCWILHGTDLAVATSGTYERGAHVVDPRTSRPATALRSVTVVGVDLAVTDAYATAALAMGPAGADWLAGLDGYECAVVFEDGRAFESAGLPRADASPANLKQTLSRR